LGRLDRQCVAGAGDRRHAECEQQASA
jgi:hypothetical protein